MPENKNSKARIAANHRYNQKAYAQLTVTVPKGQKQAIEAHAKSKGESINAFINRAIRTDMGIPEAEWKRDPESK